MLNCPIHIAVMQNNLQHMQSESNFAVAWAIL